MTDRIEAIRARHAARLRTRALPPDWALVNEDMAVLLAEVERLKGGESRTEYGLDDGTTPPWVYRTRADAENDHTPADTLLVREVITTAWRNALAPVAPDAEPTEWVWSLDDVVQEADGQVWARVIDSVYAWRSTTGHDQRDQDITELVTKYGGRVLLCKARGIGGAT